MEFNYEGKSPNGQTLVSGKIYMARATGAPDPKTGALREPADAYPRPYKAAQTGSLFSMWPQFDDDIYGYRLPQYLEFEDDLVGCAELS